MTLTPDVPRVSAQEFWRKWQPHRSWWTRLFRKKSR